MGHQNWTESQSESEIGKSRTHVHGCVTEHAQLSESQSTTEDMSHEISGTQEEQPTYTQARFRAEQITTEHTLPSTALSQETHM